MNISSVSVATWKQALFALAAWVIFSLTLSVCIGYLLEDGFLVAILIMMVGGPVGISGAIAHLILLAYPPFRQQSPLRQAIAISLGAAPLLIVAIVVVVMPGGPFHFSLEFVGFFLGLHLTPTALLATLITWLIHRFIR